MPSFVNNEIVFSDNEWVQFVTRARTPDPTTVERRDAFFASLKNDAWARENGVDSLDIPDFEIAVSKTTTTTFYACYIVPAVDSTNPQKKPLYESRSYHKCECSTFVYDRCA